VVSGEVVGEVLVVEEGGKDVTTEETVASVLELREKGEGGLVVVVSTGLIAGRDGEADIITEGVEEIRVAKAVSTAFVEELPQGRECVLGSPDEVSVVSDVGVDTRVLRVDGTVLVLGTWDADKLGLKFGDRL